MSFTEYERLVMDINCNPGRYAKLCCVNERSIFNTLSEWMQKYGPDGTWRLVQLICACQIPPAPPGRTLEPGRPTPVIHRPPPPPAQRDIPVEPPAGDCNPAMMPPLGETTNTGVRVS
jgi:hypothetical protein